LTPEPSVLTAKQDAYGRMILDHYRGHDVTEIVERDHAFTSTSGGPKYIAVLHKR